MVKYTRAKAVAQIGPCHRTFDANWEQIPQSLYAALTGRQLGELVDLLREQYLRGAAGGRREACDQGYVWDDRRQAHRGVA